MSYVISNPKQLLADLKSYVLEIVFEKLDGSLRVIKGTLKPMYLPEAYRQRNASAPLDPDTNEASDAHTIVVWDVEVGGFRSFRYDRVISCQMLMGWD